MKLDDATVVKCHFDEFENYKTISSQLVNHLKTSE